MNASLRTALAIAILGIAASAESKATVLTFDVDGIWDAQYAPQEYGDRVTSTLMGGFGYGDAEGFTPNVTTAFCSVAPALGTTGYGNLTNVFYENNEDTSLLLVQFTADPEYLVRLHSFDLAAFCGDFLSDPVINSVAVFDENHVPLFAQFNVEVSTTASTPFVFCDPLVGSSLLIQIDSRNLGHLSDSIAADNITFSQIAVNEQIPEPSSAILLGIGIAGLALRRRR